MLRFSHAFMAVGSKPLWSLQQGKPAVVLLRLVLCMRRIAPAKEEVARPLTLMAGDQTFQEDPQRGVACFEDLEHCLVAMGYENSGKLDGSGTFCVQGGAIDVFPREPCVSRTSRFLRR